MPALSQMRWLSTARLNRIVGTLASVLEVNRPLLYLNRLNLVPAFDDELIGRFAGRILAADLIADDQQALVQESITIDVMTHAAPNLKIGQRLGQKLLNRLRQMEEGSLPAGGENAMKDWDNQLAENLILGVRHRMNALACAMMIDSFTYDRWGVKISGGTWGMPAALKVTVGTAWSNVASTPLSDIFGMDQVARLTYGIAYDKITMTTPDFRNMIKTTEFANQATMILGANFLLTPAALQTKNDPEMLKIASRVIGKTIEIDDFQYVTKSNDGTITSTRALPTGTVLLSRAQDERNDNVMDMANTIPTESIVAGLIGEGEIIPSDQYGPIAYYTPAADDLNPPGVVAWAVAKAFPRKHVPEVTAVLLGV